MVDGAASGRLVTGRSLALAALLFLTLTVSGNLLERYVCSLHPFDCPKAWPVSVFDPRVPHALDLVFAALTVLAFELLRRRLPRDEGPWAPSLGAVAIVLLSTATQGLPRGFERPIAGLSDEGKGLQYFHDASHFTGVRDALARWTAEQPTMAHGSTHPPGAVILALTVHDPVVLALLWLFVSTFVASFALHRLVVCFLGDRRLASTGVLLFAALPAVQIYFGSTLDALLAAVLMAALAVHAAKPSLARAILTGLLITAAAFLSFGAWILVPTFLALEWAEHRTLKRSAIALVVAALALASLRAFGFDYFASFRMASHLENPAGFRLLADPIDYVATRVEDVAEILFFLGPAVLLGTARARGALTALPRTVVLVAVGSLAASFLTGAFRTGETARACLFLTPLLLLPLLARLHQRPDPASRDLILRTTLGFGLILQLFGDWFW